MVCDACCKHDQGWWALYNHYGEHNGQFSCLAGCGKSLNALEFDKAIQPGWTIVWVDGKLWGAVPNGDAIKRVDDLQESCDFLDVSRKKVANA